MNLRPTLAASLALALAMAWPSTASASPTYPGELQEQLDMPCVPQCTLCHRDTNGGRGTVVTPFGQAMRGAGLVLRSPEKIKPALAELEQSGIDSDGDGMGDVDELRQGRNPNMPGEGILCAKYGCGASVAPDSHADPSELALILAALGLAVSRARRRSR